MKNAKSIKNKIKKINVNGNLEKYQQEVLDKFNKKEINVNWNGNLQLDQCVFKIEKNHTSKVLDYWIKLKWKGCERFYIPFKSNNHLRNLIKRGFTFKNTALKICKDGYIILNFEKLNQENQNTDSIGIDVGRNKSFITSTNITENTTKLILNSLKKMKHGSKNKASKVRKLKQTIDNQIKQIPFDKLSKICLENMTDFKRYKKFGNINHHWPISYIFNRIQLHAEEFDVQILKINPAYTSQDRSNCGYRHKNNRLGEKFLCLSCEHETDADLNAAINIHMRGTKNAHDK